MNNENTTWSKQVNLVGNDKRVLEFGCGAGYISQILWDRGCKVTGIEIDPEAAGRAKQFCERVIIADVETLELGEHIVGETYDVALFGDVLEHLKTPSRPLVDVRDFLSQEGFIVVSVPNIAHGIVRLELLRGRFDYENVGLLDESHLRFFTRDSIMRLLESCGYQIEAIEAVYNAIPRNVVEEVMRDTGLSSCDELRRFFRLPEQEIFQYVVRAVPSSAVPGNGRGFSANSWSAERTVDYGNLRKYVSDLEDRVSVLEAHCDELERRLEKIYSTRSYRAYRFVRNLFRESK